MAFTLSHMAAALPFYRCQRWVSFEAMLIGTMLPDLPYFLNNAPVVGQHSHQWSGLLGYCLPWGLAVFVLWYWLLKPAMGALLQPWGRIGCLESAAAQAPDVQYPFGLWFAAQLKFYGMFWLKVVLGVLLGASTHLIWDGITHPDGFIARNVFWLQQPVGLTGVANMPVARLLQYASSLLGLIGLWCFVHKRIYPLTDSPEGATSRPIITLKKWNSLIIGFLVCAMSLFWGWHAVLKWHNLMIPNSYLFFAKVLVGLVQGVIVPLMVYAMAYRVLCLLIRQIQHGSSK